jgi:hypothetical protein
MAEKEIQFSSSVKYDGIFSFKEFYKFCYDWLNDETRLDISEDKYKEKLKGNSKELDIKWTGTKKVTDYFKFEIKVDFEIKDLINIEVKK